MVMQVTASTIGQAWLKSMETVLLNGEDFHDEDVTIRELLGLSIHIEKPNLKDEIVERFGDKEIIKHTLRKFQKGTIMKDRPFTYADCIYNKHGIDQFEWMVDRLKKKQESKSATISLLTEGCEDANLPCLNILDAKIRDKVVNIQFFFRSQNILGRQYANLIAIANFQKELANALSVGIGSISGYVASAHIYDYDIGCANSIINNEYVVIKDKFYSCGPKSIRQNPLFK